MNARADLRSALIPTERQTQRAILRMAGVCFREVFITAIPNGAHLAGDGIARFKQMGALKGDGLKIGFPDLLCLWKPRSGALIEVKRPKTGRLSPEQAAVHALLKAMDWPVSVCIDPEEAYHFLRAAGAPCSADWARDPI
jgi:hypothetical protein